MCVSQSNSANMSICLVLYVSTFEDQKTHKNIRFQELVVACHAEVNTNYSLTIAENTLLFNISYA